MGRSPCCDKLGLKKGPWTPEEDQKLLAYIEEHGHGNWRALPSNAELQRCGKSCRLRWTNYLRPDIKRGKFSLQEEQTIIQLHALLGNRWSAIATHLPKRTDNEIKNYWNTHLKKKLTKMGIDPVTHKPKHDALLPTVEGGQQSRNAAKLSHMAQWESARLEAEARLARQSKLLSGSDHLLPLLVPGLGVKSWPNTTTDHDQEGIGIVGATEGGARGVGSPTSTLRFSEDRTSSGPVVGSVIEFMGHGNKSSLGGLNVKEEGEFDNSLSFSFSNGDRDHNNFMEGFTELLLSSTITTDPNGTTMTMTSDEKGLGEEEGSGRSETHKRNNIDTNSNGRADYYEDNKNYWNSILNLVNSPIPHSPIF